MIAYEDGVAAIEWLEKAFGFRERWEERYVESDGSLSHAEMEAGEGLIMLATPSPDYISPKRHRETCEAARKWSEVPWVIDGVLVHINNVDEHFERARQAGARILSNVEGGPDGRRYRVEDLEGHRWYFVQEEG
jgi:uncharacterized glyoxalase superfamily protein PhnB